MTTFDERTERNLSTLLPPVQRLARAFLVAAAAALPAGITVKIIDGSRTYAEQDELYAKGRPGGPPGKIVTRARGGESNHNFAVAFDVGLFQAGKYLEDSPLYERLGPVGERVGLEWGGRWSSIHDAPHYQLKTGLSIAEMRRRHDAGISMLKGTTYESAVSEASAPAAPLSGWTVAVAGASGTGFVVPPAETDTVRATAEALGARVDANNIARRITLHPAGAAP